MLTHLASYLRCYHLHTVDADVLLYVTRRHEPHVQLFRLAPISSETDHHQRRRVHRFPSRSLQVLHQHH